MTKVLLIEDDKTIADIIQYYLLRNSYEVTLAKDAGEAVSASRSRFDIILLDIMLPDVNGIELCQELRRWNYCPIIYISCIDDDETIIKALERGGDDYIVKPFSNEVLRARIEANLRRVQLDKKQEPKRELKCKGFSLLTESHTVKRTDGVSYRLAPTEYRILLFLMTHPRQHYGADELYERIWNRPSIGDSRTVAVHIFNLRKKIEDNPEDARYLKNIWGKGYCFDPDPE